MSPLVFLKFGGSLITDKDRPHTPRIEIIRRLANEVAEARSQSPDLKLILGHGSGSFGHTPARQYNTRQGVRTASEWQGFSTVWGEARALNHLVVEALCAAGLPVIAFPPSAWIVACDGRPAEFSTHPIQMALDAGLVPLVNGDVVFDTARGGTILSTEDVFSTLAATLRPSRVLMTGIEAGVWIDFPACTQVMAHITSASFSSLGQGLSGSASVDVTGGMRQKVELMLHLARQVDGLEAYIFSGLESGLVQHVLSGGSAGTRITYI
jgi:isopentenyl phosphate kinase